MAVAPARGGAGPGRWLDPPGHSRMSEPGYDSGPDTPLEAIGGLARLAAGAWVRTASWGLGASVRVVRAATDPRQAFELAQEFGDGVRGYAREVLGVSDLDRR